MDGNGRASRDRPETHPAIAPRTADGRKLGKFLSRADLSDCSPAERLFKRAAGLFNPTLPLYETREDGDRSRNRVIF
jgi:hypothetical protein